MIEQGPPARDDIDFIGIETGFCHFCRYEIETKPYEMPGPEPRQTAWLCDFCAMLSRNDMRDRILRSLNWGLNHILKKLLSEEATYKDDCTGDCKSL